MAIIVMQMVLIACGCGSWPPIVENRRDIERLPASEPSVRARGLSDADISSLSHFHHLCMLDFGGGHAVKDARLTDEGLARLSKLDLPELETLTLDHCRNITDSGLIHVGQMHTVSWLSLMACPKLTDAGLPHLHTMRGLTALDLRGCSGITDRGLQHLEAMNNLQTILLGGCSNLTDSGVARLQMALPNTKVEKDEREWSFHK